MPNWLKDAVFYEIYPQSFYDSNGDGIGDIPGITEKLDYIRSLGCNALWLNPVYDSPFYDAGYDVRDYKKVAPRYGSNEDLFRLFNEAHERDMRVILDLVPGHTSIDHPWFLEAKKAGTNSMSGRYIFSRTVWDIPPGYLWVSGTTERDGNFLVNFFSTQPALNYGFHDINDPGWQNPPDHPDCRATLEALIDIIRFWLENGADGFRVDMADSLVKNDDEKVATAALWRKVRSMLDNEYPDAAMVSEWSCPERAINNAGFHMDFYLDHVHNGYHSLFRKREDGTNRCYVGKEAPGDIMAFINDFVPNYEKIKGNGYISFLTCNHDTPRLTRYLEINEIKLAYALIFTMPGVPFLYYGDEIGMRFIEGLNSKEGGYNRTGTRTPMQWTRGKNLGFSDADPAALYLPVDSGTGALDSGAGALDNGAGALDSGAGAPTVQEQQETPDSLLNTVKSLISLRRSYTDLNADGGFEVVHAQAGDPLFAYRRGSLLLLVNPSAEDAVLHKDMLHRDAPCETTQGSRVKFEDSRVIFTIGKTKAEKGQIILSPQSFAVVVI